MDARAGAGCGPSPEGDEDDFRSWVFTIAHPRLVDERRKLGRTPRTAPFEEQRAAPTLGPSADHTVVDEARWEQQHLAVLTALQRDVVLLRVVAGLTVAETAAVVDRSEAAVRQLQHRGLRTLEEDLRDRSPGGDLPEGSGGPDR